MIAPRARASTDPRTSRLRDGHLTTISGLDPGAYTVTITASDGALPPVASTALIWPTT